MTKETEGKIKQSDLLEEVAIALQECFEGEVVLTENDIKISFCNGQNVTVNVYVE